MVQDLIAHSRIEIDQVRLYVYRTAWLIDRYGARGARTEIAGIKVAAPADGDPPVMIGPLRSSARHGVSDDTPLAYFYARARILRIVNEPAPYTRRRRLTDKELKRRYRACRPDQREASGGYPAVVSSTGSHVVLSREEPVNSPSSYSASQ